MRLGINKHECEVSIFFSIHLIPGLDDTMCQVKDNYISAIPYRVLVFFLVLFCKHKLVIYNVNLHSI